MNEVVWGCLSNGCSDDRGMYGLPVGASEESEQHLVMDANVSKPIQFKGDILLTLYQRIVGFFFPYLRRVFSG